MAGPGSTLGPGGAGVPWRGVDACSGQCVCERDGSWRRTRVAHSARDVEASVVCGVGCRCWCAVPAMSGLRSRAGVPSAGPATLADDTLARGCPNRTRASTSATTASRCTGGVRHRGRPERRLFVTDFGGRRVLTWPNVNALTPCSGGRCDRCRADGRTRGGDDRRPDRNGLRRDNARPHGEGISRDADARGGASSRSHARGCRGAGDNQFFYPRGLAVDPGGRLFVADDFNNRVRHLRSAVHERRAAADGIGAGANGASTVQGPRDGRPHAVRRRLLERPRAAVHRSVHDADHLRRERGLHRVVNPVDVACTATGRC